MCVQPFCLYNYIILKQYIILKTTQLKKHGPIYASVNKSSVFQARSGCKTDTYVLVDTVIETGRPWGMSSRGIEVSRSFLRRWLPRRARCVELRGLRCVCR